MNGNLPARDPSKILKKKIIVIMITVLLIVAELTVIFYMISCGFFIRQTQRSGGGFIFYPDIDYTYDIMQDEGYVELITPSFITYKDESAGTSVSVPEESYESYGDSATGLLIRLLLSVQAGDADSYNACFGDEYLVAVGRASLIEDGKDPTGYSDGQLRELGLEPSFTMQKVYDAVITDYGSSRQTDGSGNAFDAYYYRLEYKIRHNNGTFRTDMDSDSYRPQDIVIRLNADGEYEIISVTTYYTEIPYEETPIVGRIAATAIIGAAVFIGVIVLASLYIKKLNGSEKEDGEETSDN